MPAPERTSLADIVAAGCDLLEGGGRAHVTMQAVAQRVGVRAPSLYKRVRDRDALLRLVATAHIDRLVERLDPADTTIAGVARTFRAYAQEQPEGFRLILSSIADAESLARATSAILQAAEALVGPAEALDAARLVTAWTTGFITMELAGAFRLDGDLDQAFDYALERLQVALTR
ncbi:TetR/AcrR family transcriptional regulator [Nocardioides lijunqiniae]|uniref:TetR/AcrR family transcriptional regulator n=1 Tax=Nocardioides lijunqiniae TaxID=2760832 RepID=UPI001878A6C8|nr:TetR-like C-terminal domain-containing protein [Nocardioides lijunqiniae]